MGIGFGSLKNKFDMQMPTRPGQGVPPQAYGHGGGTGTVDPLPRPPSGPIGGPGGTVNPLPPGPVADPRFDIFGGRPGPMGAAPITNYGQTDQYGNPYQQSPQYTPHTPFAPGNMPQRPPEYTPHTPFDPTMFGGSPWLSMLGGKF